MTDQPSHFVSISFYCKCPLQKSVQEPSPLQNEYPQNTRKSDTWGENPLEMMQNCGNSEFDIEEHQFFWWNLLKVRNLVRSNSLGICPLEVLESGGIPLVWDWLIYLNHSVGDWSPKLYKFFGTPCKGRHYQFQHILTNGSWLVQVLIRTF